jgi:hypothetical protein
LQFTVAVFLAEGAVLGVVRQEEFYDRLAGTAHTIAVGLDFHPFCNRVDARCDQVTTPLHLNDADPTGSRGMMDLQVCTKSGYLDPDLLGRFKDGRFFGYLYALMINC